MAYRLQLLSCHIFFCLHQARFWVQVTRDLRDGVKLKKVQERRYNPLPIEYQLTPYEMLMGDIRSQLYKLRKVMVRWKYFNLFFISLVRINQDMYITIGWLPRPPVYINSRMFW